jgi:hypothetical protein
VQARRISLALTALVFATGDARGQDPAPPRATAPQGPAALEPVPVAFSADEVRLDVHAAALAVTGDVRVDEPPFYFTSDALELKRVPIGVELRGRGRLAFCHCLGSPIAVSFSGATVAPPHDTILRNPVLEIFGLPVAWLPLFWLRSTGRVGVLPPDVAWRGRDGLFLGDGVHVPWTQGDRDHGIDVRAGGYVDGGVVVDTALRTPTSATHLRWDRLRGADGVTVDAFGASAVDANAPAESVAWDVHALRGARAVEATSDVDEAARRVDRAQAEAAFRSGGWTIASGVRAAAPRGGEPLDFGAVGPVLVVRRADGLANAGTYEVTLEGGEIAGGGAGSTSFARGNAGALLAGRAGPFGASAAIRAFGDVAQGVGERGWDGTAQVRAAVTLPLARDYASAIESAPWRHRTEPRIEAAVVATRVGDALAVLPGPGTMAPAGRAWIAAAGWSNAVGRFGSGDAAEADVSGGAVGTDARALPAIRARAAIGNPWAALRADFARVFAPAGTGGGAWVASGRVGPATGLHISAHVAERDGVDPVVARALVDPPLEPDSRFLVVSGWTGGARIGLPLGSRVTARGGADVDFGARELVDATGTLEFHDPCGCVVLRANGAYRIGRPGVDVWLAVDVPLASR